MASSWRRSASLVVLLVFAAFPVTGTLCAALCAAPATAAAPVAGHHASASDCHATGSADASVRGTSRHDCGAHERTGRDGLATPVVRADATANPIARVLGPAAASFPPPAAADHPLSGASPPGRAALPVAALLVLRI